MSLDLNKRLTELKINSVILKMMFFLQTKLLVFCLMKHTQTVTVAEPNRAIIKQRNTKNTVTLEETHLIRLKLTTAEAVDHSHWERISSGPV